MWPKNMETYTLPPPPPPPAYKIAVALGLGAKAQLRNDNISRYLLYYIITPI